MVRGGTFPKHSGIGLFKANTPIFIKAKNLNVYNRLLFLYFDFDWFSFVQKV